MTSSPVFAAAVAKGLRDRRAGARIALGHGTIETWLLSLLLSLSAQVLTAVAVRTEIAPVGGMLLIVMGVRMFMTKKTSAP
jgi:threonine/homoserine/homoserine lactone efflux protein